MNAFPFLGALTLTVLVAACANRQDANATNFSSAIVQYLKDKGKMCFGNAAWPIDVDVREFHSKGMRADEAAQMAALENVGLATSTEIELERPMVGKIKARRYSLTEAGRKFFHPKAPIVKFAGDEREYGDLCYGQQILDKVVKWEGPLKSGDYQEVNVKYHYRVTNLADWMKQPITRAAFSRATEKIDGAGKRERSLKLKLTSEGWEAERNFFE